MREYKVSTFIMDLILGCITGGLWWIYRIIKIIVMMGNRK